MAETDCNGLDEPCVTWTGCVTRTGPRQYITDFAECSEEKSEVPEFLMFTVTVMLNGPRAKVVPNLPSYHDSRTENPRSCRTGVLSGVLPSRYSGKTQEICSGSK